MEGQKNVEFIIDDISVNKDRFKYGPIVYRLGQLVFIQQRGVRFPLGPPNIMHKIAIIEKIHQDGINLLKDNPNFEFEIIEDTSEENLIKVLPNFDACTLRVSKLNRKIMSNCKKLKVISRHGVGYDNVDLDYIKKNNIALLITATANAVAVAEHVIYMMISISKGINQYDHQVRIGNFKKMHHLL